MSEICRDKTVDDLFVCCVFFFLIKLCDFQQLQAITTYVITNYNETCFNFYFRVKYISRG